MEKKLFIGSLPYSTTDEELQRFIADKTGYTLAINTENRNDSDVVVIIDKFTNKSKGFGFADFRNVAEIETAEQLQEVVNKLNGQEFGGRTIVANVARPREERPRNDNGPRRY